MNKKRFSLFAIGALTAIGVLAIPARQGIRQFTQADGTTITLRLIGDEYFHTFLTEDGIPVTKTADGNFHYRTAEGITAVIAHDVAGRTPAENSFVKSSIQDLSLTALKTSRTPAIKARRAQFRSAAAKKASQVPNNGSPRVPIILVQYKDYKFKDSDPKATFTSFFSKGATSAYQYFADQSNGKYTPQFDVYGPYTLSGNRSVYGGNDMWGDDKGVGKMVAEGCNGLNSQIDFSRYDNNGDGECDVVIVLYAGDGEASSYDDDCENSVWPCQWELSDSDYGRALTLDGTLVNKFAVFNELNGENLSKIDGIGTFCHEFSHCLGLPDFYDTEYGPHFGMGYWSLMDNGSYNNSGYTPIGYSAYEKEFMGWITVPEAKENTFYTLPVFNQKDAAKDMAVKISNSSDANEYFIIENRARQGWDEYIPTDGMLITHVTYDAKAWDDNVVNNYDMQRMTPVPADNSLKLDTQRYQGETYYIINENDLKGDLWPYGQATEFTDTSKPAAKLNSGGGYLGKPVTEMAINNDGSASFWFMKTPLPAVGLPLLDPHSVTSSSSFIANWKPGCDNNVTYTLEVYEHKDITYAEVLKTDFSSSSHGWTSEGYTVAADGGMRMGSGTRTGTLISPVLKTDGSDVMTVVFNAEYYNNDESSVIVSLLNTSGTKISSQTIKLSDTQQDYVVVLDTDGYSDVKITFATVAARKRVILYSSVIYTGDASEAVEAASSLRAPSVSGDQTHKVITGITTTSYHVTGLKEKGVYDYRVKAVPVDSESLTESKWTEAKTVNLGSESGIENVVSDNSADGIEEYYNLQGMRVESAHLTPGVYIIRQGDKVRKVLVK